MEIENRFFSLDSLRGIACLQVVIGHCFFAIPAFGWICFTDFVNNDHDLIYYLAYSPLHFLVAGPEAVKIFFVLSGFVLSIPFYKSDVTAKIYANYFVKRLLRLYIPCAAIIIIGLIVKMFLYNTETVLTYSKFITTAMTEDFSGKNLVNVFLLQYPVTNLDPPLWTLRPEILLSLILPFFVFIIRRANLIVAIFLILGNILVNTLAKRLGLYNYLPDLSTLYYFSFFLFGSIMCKFQKPIKHWIDSTGLAFYSLLIIVSLFLYTFEFSMWWLPRIVLSKMILYRDYVAAIPGMLFIALALSDRMKTLLNNTVLLFIGKISFSLYLVHPIVFYSSVYLFGNSINSYVLISIAFVISFPLSFLFNRFIESPSMSFSKRIAQKLFPI